jgi:methyltransferase
VVGVSSQIAFTFLLALLAIERLYELRLSARNVRWALSQGGVESGQAHFGWMKLLHTSLFVGCLLEVWWIGSPFTLWLAVPMLTLALLSQALRYWAISALGRRWNVGVVVVPSDAVTSGPYRWMRHPNYLAVITEGIVVPLIHSAWITAVVFTVLNAVLLWVRIRCEERALTQHCRYQERLGARARFVPMASVGACAEEP